MPTLLDCPNGHRWARTGTSNTPARCPVCGASAVDPPAPEAETLSPDIVLMELADSPGATLAPVEVVDAVPALPAAPCHRP
jgi:hypothetical protein